MAMSSKRIRNAGDHLDFRDRRIYFSDDNAPNYERYPYEDFNDRRSTRGRSGRRYEYGRSFASSLMDPQQHQSEHQVARNASGGGLGAATLDHLVNGPDHRAEEPLEGSKQQAKLSYSLAGPFNRKVCPFDSPAVDGINISSQYYSMPRILSPEASPRGGDSISSSDSGTCLRLKQKFMKMTPSASVTPDQTGVVNGFSSSNKTLAQLQQRMRNQPNYEKENDYNSQKSKGGNANRFRIRPSYPSGPIDEKAGLRPAVISRKVVEGPTGPQYKGFSRGTGNVSVSRGASGVTNDTTGNLGHRSESHGNLFSNRRNDSQNSLNTVHSQPSTGKKPNRKDNISTRSWRKGQELILRELGPNKSASTPNMKNNAKEDEVISFNVNNSNDEGLGMDKETPIVDTSQTKKRKAVAPKPQPTQEYTPSKPKVRHYDVSEVRVYLRKQQEARKRKRQEEEAANQARVERVRRQIEELRNQQLDAMKKHVALPPPPSPPMTTEVTPPQRNLNKTYLIDPMDDEEIENVEENFADEAENERGLPITIQDLETPGKEAPLSPTYQLPREKYHEVWPPRVNGDTGATLPSTFSHLSPRNGDRSLDPPVAVASRLTALEESANLLQSRIWQLAHRVGNNPAAEEPHRERSAFLSQSVPYQVHHSIEEDSREPPPPFLSRYDRLAWDTRAISNPLEEEPYLPGNTTVPEYPTVPYQFASAAFLDDSTSEASEDFVVQDAAKQVSVSPVQRQNSKRRTSQLAFRPYASVGERRKKIMFKDVAPSRRPPRLESECGFRDDPFSFMRTYKRQRHLHRLHPKHSGDPEEYHTDSTVSEDQNYETETTSHAESDEELYSDDFSGEDTKEAPVISDGPISRSKEEEEDEDVMDEEYEDDFTSIAVPQTSSQRSGSYSHSHTAAPQTDRSNILMNSDEVLESNIQSRMYEDLSASRRLHSEGMDQVADLPRPRLQAHHSTVPSSTTEPDLPLRLSPSSLERKLLAELHYLESVEESVRQVGDIERVRAVSMSQQETVSLAQILKARQLTHNQELQETQMKAKQDQVDAANQLWNSRQQFLQSTELTAQSIDQVRKESAHALESTRRIIESQQRATEAAVDAAQQLAQAKFTMSANFGRGMTDVSQQVTLSRSTPLPVRSHSPTSHSSSWRGSGSRSSPSKRRTDEVDEESSWSKPRLSEADTDEDESTIQTDTPKFEEQSTGDSTDEDILDHSFRMVLPSEEHRRHGRRTKDVATANVGYNEAGAEESNTPSFRRFTDDMVRQYMREEELRAQHQITLLKLRKNALGEKMHTELEFLETQKRQLLKQQAKARQQGPHNQLMEKQLALIRRWKQEEAEIDQLLEAQELADKRRQIMLEQDAQIAKMKNEAKKIRAEKGNDEHSKRLDKSHNAILKAIARSLADWEQKLQVRRQRAEELIRLQEKLKNEEKAVKKLEIEALKIWKETPSHSDRTSASESVGSHRSTTATSNSSNTRSSGSAVSVRRRSSPSSGGSTKGDSEAPPRLHIGESTNESASTINEEVSTDETSTISQESVVLSTRLIKRSEDESSIQEELDKGNERSRHDTSSDSIPEDVGTQSPTQSIRTETIAGATTTTVTESVKTEIPTTGRSRSPPSASYGPDTFESTSNTTSRLKRRLGDSIISSLTSPRGPPKQIEAKVGASHPSSGAGRGGLSEDEDSFSCATTTMSEGTEISDMEGRLHALKEDLKHRVRTLNRLKREKARVNRERLKQKEELLHKHIEMYDKYITDLKAELDQDIRDASTLDSSLGTPVKPQIKAPKATTRDRSRNNSTDERRLISDSQESLKHSENSKKEEVEEDIYSTNFSSAETNRSESHHPKFDDDDSSSTQSDRSRKLTERTSRHSKEAEDKSDVETKSSSSISEALSKSVGSASTTDRRKTASKGDDDDIYSQSFISEQLSESKNVTITASPRAPTTEISEYLPSQVESTNDSSSWRDRSGRPFKKSAAEVSEQISEQLTSSDSRSDLNDNKSSTKTPAESVESLSDLFPSSVETKPESVVSEVVKTAEDIGDATPRTPRRLTFSEINEEYSPSEDTKSKDSAESDIIKPLPNLDLRPLSPVSPEPPREKSPVLPLSLPGDEDEKQDQLPLSARTIHSQMSDIPEDLPSTEQVASEKTDDDYSYSEEFSAASSRPASSRSHFSEPTRSHSTSSSSSTVAPSESRGTPTTSIPEEKIEEPESDTWSVDVMDLKRKSSDVSDGKDAEVKPTVIDDEALSDLKSIEKVSDEDKMTEEKESEIVSIDEEEIIEEELSDTASVEKISETNSEKKVLVGDIKEEERKPVKRTVSEDKVAAIVAGILEDTLKDTLSVGLVSALARRVTKSDKGNEEEDNGVWIEGLETRDLRSSATVFDEPEGELLLQERENDEKLQISPRWREDSPTLVRSKSVELLAEDELAGEFDRALAKRRMKRRLSNGSDVDVQSPPASPTVSANYLLSDQDSSMSEPVFGENIITSTPAAAPQISTSTQRVPQDELKPTEAEPCVPTFVPEPIPDEPSAPEPQLPATKSSESELRPTSPPIILHESSLRIEEERTHLMVPHARRHIREMVTQAVFDLWPFVRGPDTPRLDQLPPQPSFDFCLVGEAEESTKGPFVSLPEDVVIRSRRAYKHMIYNLILDIVRRIYAEEVPLRPWMCSRPTRYRLWKDTKPPSTSDKLLAIVIEEIETHMAFVPSKKRESKLTQWSRKKRAGLVPSTAISVDPVDDLLKSELRTEEADWVNYESEEFQVKLQVAEGLLIDLIDDTVQAVQQARKSTVKETTPLSSIPGLLSREIQSGWLDDSNPSLLL